MPRWPNAVNRRRCGPDATATARASSACRCDSRKPATPDCGVPAATYGPSAGTRLPSHVTASAMTAAGTATQAHAVARSTETNSGESAAPIDAANCWISRSISANRSSESSHHSSTARWVRCNG
ncbi:Uncharacterised protein [Mycobacteroides abscessus subsp. abscessus]|nr:Uncharacterised protein [Mycobacteroides abscessus subsp. abscessus]